MTKVVNINRNRKHDFNFGNRKCEGKTRCIIMLNKEHIMRISTEAYIKVVKVKIDKKWITIGHYCPGCGADVRETK
jgi:hypothetical protein